MKRHGNIFDKIICVDNLKIAAATAAKAAGRLRAVISFYKNEEENIQRLHQNLDSGFFSPSQPRTFIIHEPKERLITTAPFYPDKIVEQAIVQVIEPFLTPVFVRDTYASIKGRGCYLLSQRIRKAMNEDRNGCRYCLQADIHHAFPNVSHDILIDLLRRKIKDERTISLIRSLLNTPGLKIGGRMSQMFFNFYMSYFDHWLKETKKIKHYHRYMDNLGIFGDNKEDLHTLLAEITDYLRKNLGLTLNPDYQIYPVAVDRHDRHGRPVDIAGYVIHLNQTRLRKRIKKNFCRKLAKLNKKDLPHADFLQAIAPWWGWLISTDSEYLIKKLQQTTQHEIKFHNTPELAA